jgi:hypothetical protein
VLPAERIDLLAIAVTGAVGLAAEVRLVDGYNALLAGLKRAEDAKGE